MGESKFIVYTYETVDNKLECHAYGCTQEEAFGTKEEADNVLKELVTGNAALTGMVLPLESVGA
jgi:hypothetical protein